MHLLFNLYLSCSLNILYSFHTRSILDPSFKQDKLSVESKKADYWIHKYNRSGAFPRMNYNREWTLDIITPSFFCDAISKVY